MRRRRERPSVSLAFGAKDGGALFRHLVDVWGCDCWIRSGRVVVVECRAACRGQRTTLDLLGHVTDV